MELALVEGYLIFISLLPEANWYLAGVDTQVDVVITGDAPAALERRCDTLELQVSITALFPLLTCSRQAINPPIHVYSPQEGARHGALCNTHTQPDNYSYSQRTDTYFDLLTLKIRLNYVILII